jgi:hypothetical protein
MRSAVTQVRVPRDAACIRAKGSALPAQQKLSQDAGGLRWSCEHHGESPPRAEARPAQVARDLVVLLDTSGSMHPAFFDRDEAGREEAFEVARGLRRMEAALDPEGLSTTARAVLARIRAAQY